MRRRRLALLALLVPLGACNASPGTESIAIDHLALLTREGCVDTTTMRSNVDEALRTMGRGVAYQIIDLASLPSTDARRGYPTPTLLYDNKDVFGMDEAKPPYPEPA